MEGFLFQAVIYLLAAVISVPLSVRLGLGSVLGYIFAGLMIGPVFGLVADTEDLKHFAEYGVVLMLFLIGLELSPRTLWDMRLRLLGLGGLQVTVTTLAVTGGAIMLFGMPWQTALAVGMIFALSSTAIVLQTLTEKGLMQTGGGRASFSVLLTQDVAVIPMLAILPLLAVPGALSFEPDGSIARAGMNASGIEAPAAGGPASGEAAGPEVLAPEVVPPEIALALTEQLPAWGVTLLTLAAVTLVMIFGIVAVRPLFRFVHFARLRELYTAFALLIVVGIAFLMTLVGLSPALGTFLAGVLLANTEFRHELESDIQPFKGLLLGLFFITVGAGMNFAAFLRNPFEIFALTLLLMILKGVVLYLLALVFRLRGRDKWLFTLGLAQAGEFGFVLISFAVQQTVVGPALGEELLLVVALSMLLTPLAFIAYERLQHRMSAAATDQREPDRIDEQQPIIIAGIGRFGQVVNRLLMLAGFRAVVLDHNLEAVETMRRFGIKGFFGDPTRPELLHAAGLDNARVLVVALDDRDGATRLVKYARAQRPDLHIIARARDRVHVYQLYQAGANDIVRELFDSSLRAGRYALENMGLTESEAAKIERFFYAKDREGMRELATLWDPGVPVAENEAYVQRAREINAELETALVQHLEDDPFPISEEAVKVADAADEPRPQAELDEADFAPEDASTAPAQSADGEPDAKSG